MKHAPGERLEVFENGHWHPCVITSIADYVGKSGAGYYAAYDTPRERCSSFWCYDRILRERGPSWDDYRKAAEGLVP
jgi:hypothetical protein